MQLIKDIEKILPKFDEDNATYDNVERPPKIRGRFLRAIKILESYEQGWDGNDSLPPHPKALKTTATFIINLAWQRTFPSSIYPGSDRSVVLEWEEIKDVGKLILTIDPYYIGAVSILQNGDIVDLGDFNLLPETTLPQKLQSIIPRT